MIGVKPLFGDKNVAEGDKADFDVVFVSPDGKPLARDGLRYELLKIESRYQWYRQNSSWDYEPVKSTTRVADGDLTIAADKPSRITLSPQPGRYRLDVKSSDADGPLTSVQFDVGWYSDGSADTPDLLETSIDKPEYQSGDTMAVSVNARIGRQAHHQRARRPAADHADHPTSRKAPRRSRFRSARTGAPAPMWWRRCAVRSMWPRSACRAAPSA